MAKKNAKKATKAANTATAKTTTAAAATAEVKETKTADSIKETVKEATTKVAEKVAEKAPEVKKTAKKAAKADVVVETFFEFDGNQVMAEELVERIKEAYKAEGHRVGNIKTLRTYVNPVERRAYYVINDKAENKYIEF